MVIVRAAIIPSTTISPILKHCTCAIKNLALTPGSLARSGRHESKLCSVRNSWRTVVRVPSMWGEPMIPMLLPFSLQETIHSGRLNIFHMENVMENVRRMSQYAYMIPLILTAFWLHSTNILLTTKETLLCYCENVRRVQPECSQNQWDHVSIL